MSKGTNWSKANTTTLRNGLKKLNEDYVKSYQETQAKANALRSALNTEWQARYPEGVKGLVCRFNVLNGTILYAMVDYGTMTFDPIDPFEL